MEHDLVTRAGTPHDPEPAPDDRRDGMAEAFDAPAATAGSPEEDAFDPPTATVGAPEAGWTGAGAPEAGAPEDDAFETALAAAIARLPDAYRAQLATVAIVIADEATPDELAELGVHGLYGLYRGIPRTVLAADGMAVPNVITLYRGPLERDHRSPHGLQGAVEDTLRHELAHHLGISDARLHELKRR